MNHYRSGNGPIGCFIIVWLLGAIFTIAFWILVAYGLWEGIQWLQRN